MCTSIPPAPQITGDVMGRLLPHDRVSDGRVASVTPPAITLAVALAVTLACEPVMQARASVSDVPDAARPSDPRLWASTDQSAGGRQGWPLRRLGRARAVYDRDPGGVQAAAL